MDNTSDQSRSISNFNLDSKLFLEREISLFGTDLIQTLTPRLAYNYTPKKDQSALPNFDSADTNDSYEGLFSGKKFTGIDRINDANDFTLGLESDFINDETGDTYLSLKAAQSFYRHEQLVHESMRKYSDIAASIDVSLNDFTFNTSLQFDQKNSEIFKRDSSLTYLLNPRKFLTLAHYYDKDNDDPKSVELHGAYPLTQQVHVFLGVNRSINKSTDKWTTSKETTGIAYESCCWALRLAHFREHIRDSDYNYVTEFELVLKGLASTSPDLSKRLEENIPNYLANLDD